MPPSIPRAQTRVLGAGVGRELVLLLSGAPALRPQGPFTSIISYLTGSLFSRGWVEVCLRRVLGLQRRGFPLSSFSANTASC